MARKRKRSTTENTISAPKEASVPSERPSDEPALKKTKWINRERVLIFSSRGISYRDRHLMKDLQTMMPHSKSDTKMDRKDKLPVINEICEMKNCQKCIYFESKKKQDLYMWVANAPNGPSAKFLVENASSCHRDSTVGADGTASKDDVSAAAAVHTMEELKMTGNCLRGSRPLLSFDKSFDEHPHFALLKEMFIQIFSTPNHHPRSQPFIDHVFTFSVADNRIWFRNFQILKENGELAEIGPRMVLNPIRIFKGSFGGPTLFQNSNYISPNEYRRSIRRESGNKYADKIAAKKSLEMRKGGPSYKIDATDDVFKTE